MQSGQQFSRTPIAHPRFQQPEIATNPYFTWLSADECGQGGEGVADLAETRKNISAVFRAGSSPLMPNANFLIF
jgi:hypothetical protein